MDAPEISTPEMQVAAANLERKNALQAGDGVREKLLGQTDLTPDSALGAGLEFLRGQSRVLASYLSLAQLSRTVDRSGLSEAQQLALSINPTDVENAWSGQARRIQAAIAEAENGNNLKMKRELIEKAEEIGRTHGVDKGTYVGEPDLEFAQRLRDILNLIPDESV